MLILDLNYAIGPRRHTPFFRARNRVIEAAYSMKGAHILAAVVNLGGVQFGGSSNQVGVYNGQNMQNGWDSNSPNMSVFGAAMGQLCLQGAWLAPFYAFTPGSQTIFDNDLKDNASPLLQGP